ncbi:putative serine/threonine-protein kinase [Aphelenchoides fujianensis]|nr:putative serine/threonine-protein kinase [Aphelenchoides fujianensis]
MIDGDHNAPYYRTAPSSSEGELSDDADEAAGGEAPKKVVPPASTAAEDDRHVDEEPKAAARPNRPQRPRIEAPAASPPTTSARPEGRQRPTERTERSPPPKRRHDSPPRRSAERPPRSRSPGCSSTPDFDADGVARLRVAEAEGRRSGTPASATAGRPKRSRFESPEGGGRAASATPNRSSLSDVEVEELAAEPPAQPDAVLAAAEAKPLEQLSDEEKAMLRPDVLAAKEREHAERERARLPVYYPGIRGCRSIDEFRLLNRVSEGTFGVVFRAEERQTREIVALKQLKMEREREGFPITSLREINMLMKCRRHPNVVGLREIVTDATGEKIYLVMEFVEHDLRALMRQLEHRRKRFTLAQVKTLMHQLLSGLAYMHEEWVIHRDLKTANLLLSHGNILKIGDFGLAREYGDPLKGFTQLVVTLHYRSPELLLGCKTYSTKVDVWSVGCIFGEFLKLTPVLPGTSEADQLRRTFELCGAPTEDSWPGHQQLPLAAKMSWPPQPHSQLERRFARDLHESEKKAPEKSGLDLMRRYFRVAFALFTGRKGRLRAAALPVRVRLLDEQTARRTSGRPRLPPALADADPRPLLLLSVYFNLEPPHLSFSRAIGRPMPPDFFNATATYRSSSEVSYPYDAFVLRDGSESAAEEIDRKLRAKRNASLIAASNCGADSRRHAYVDALAAAWTSNSHHFYLAFENAVCPEYASEKFWRVKELIAPVVNSRAAVPPHISADAFAAHLRWLIERPAECRKFFAWTKRYRRSSLNEAELNVSCQLCKLAHRQPQRRIADYRHEWSRRECVRDFAPDLLGDSSRARRRVRDHERRMAALVGCICRPRSLGRIF